jgi:hypothetical protein
MAQPQSRQELKEYCLRKLGAPVIEINVDDSQLEDRIDDALSLYAEYHFDGVERRYYKYQVTQEDIDRASGDPNGGYISTNGIDSSIISVIRLFQFSESSVNMFDVRYQMALNDFYGIRTGLGSINNYDITKRHLSLLQQMLDPEKMIRFTRVTNKLYVDMNWEEDVTAGDYLVFECYSVIDPETYTEIYKDKFILKYTTELFRYQWGANLSKYDGIQLPGGVQFNGRQIMDDARTQLDKLEEEMSLRYELPPDFMVG